MGQATQLVLPLLVGQHQLRAQALHRRQIVAVHGGQQLVLVGMERSDVGQILVAEADLGQFVRNA